MFLLPKALWPLRNGIQGQFRSKGRGKGMVLMKGGKGGRGRGSTPAMAEFPGVDQIIRLAEQVMSVHSTRHPLTTNKKIALLMKRLDL